MSQAVISDTHAVHIQPQKGQGAQVEWMPQPAGIPGCPLGLEYLAQIDQMVIAQRVDLAEVLLGWEVANRFTIRNSMGQQIYLATEESTCAQRQFCKQAREFTYHITDNNNQEVLTLHKEFMCCSGCCWCANSDMCAWIIEVKSTSSGEVLGYVRQSKTCWKTYLSLLDANKQEVGKIKGPCCPFRCPCCGDAEFPLEASDGTVMGKIAKQWSGALKELFTNANNFAVTFPVDLDVRMKATLFGGVFLLDMLLFENNNN